VSNLHELGMHERCGSPEPSVKDVKMFVERMYPDEYKPFTPNDDFGTKLKAWQKFFATGESPHDAKRQFMMSYLKANAKHMTLKESDVDADVVHANPAYSSWLFQQNWKTEFLFDLKDKFQGEPAAIITSLNDL